MWKQDKRFGLPATAALGLPRCRTFAQKDQLGQGLADSKRFAHLGLTVTRQQDPTNR